MIAEKLRSEAKSVFNRETVPTPHISTSIRLSALLVAGESNEIVRRQTWQNSTVVSFQPESPAASLFRDTAATITWLESRRKGAYPATETIMLEAE
jgi:hypothetical protein